jgi:hypothetical protein
MPIPGSVTLFALHKVYAAHCRGVQTVPRDVPAGVLEFPFQSIVVTCLLCGERRRYVPSEVLLGRTNHLNLPVTGSPREGDFARVDG